MKCFACDKETIEKNKNYIADLEHCVIIIKNVPALVCQDCGEVYYRDEVAEKIEKTIDMLEKIIDDVAVVEYSKMTA